MIQSAALGPGFPWRPGEGDSIASAGMIHLSFAFRRQVPSICLAVL
jgi:hypothetical protein